LADELGSGKTIEALSLFHVFQKNCYICGPFVVVAPLSTVANWIHEIEEWTTLRVVALSTNEESRKIMKKHCFFPRTQNIARPDRENLIVDIIVVLHELVCMELAFLKKIEFVYATFDEGHRLKNSQSLIYQASQSLYADYVLFMMETRQNNVSEL
jgi:SNF2 family DNA or RNA helicase